MKRTPLNRGSSELQRTPLKRGETYLQRNTRLRPRSDKMTEKYVDRKLLRERLLQERPRCQACIPFYYHDLIVLGLSSEFRVRTSVDLHEIKNRSQGGDILDESGILCVCRTCHDRIGAEPKVAELLGLHVESWATDQHIEEAHSVRAIWTVGQAGAPSWL